MTAHKLLRGLPYLFCLALLFFSCKSSRQVTSNRAVVANSSQKYLGLVLDQAPAFDSFSSKVRFSARLDGKDLSVSGSIKIKKNEIIQLSVAPFLGIEVARAEITPEYILVIDRMNKRYVQAPLSFLKSLGNTNLDFYSLQALFYNELFLPGVQEVGVKDIGSFDFSQDADGITTIRSNKPGSVNIGFATVTADARLTACRITSGSSFLFEWLYAGFQPFSGKMFPALMEVSLQSSGKNASLVMEFSRMSRGKEEVPRTGIPKKYQQVDLDDLIKQLMK